MLGEERVRGGRSPIVELVRLGLLGPKSGCTHTGIRGRVSSRFQSCFAAV